MAGEAPAEGHGVSAISKQAADLAIIVVDPRGVVLGADARFLHVTGHTRDEVEGRDVRSLLAFDDPLGPHCGGLVGGPQRTIPGWYFPKSGGRFPATLTLAPVTDDRGAFAALTIVLRPL